MSVLRYIWIITSYFQVIPCRIQQLMCPRLSQPPTSTLLLYWWETTCRISGMYSQPIRNVAIILLIIISDEKAQIYTINIDKWRRYPYVCPTSINLRPLVNEMMVFHLQNITSYMRVVYIDIDSGWNTLKNGSTPICFVGYI